MKKNCLYICDNDENYCMRLYGYLKEKISVPFEIMGFTDESAIEKITDTGNNSILVISEEMFKKKMSEVFSNIIILSEKAAALNEDSPRYGEAESEEGPNIKHIDKYQSCEKIAKSIIGICLEMPEVIVTGIPKGEKGTTRIITFCTPVRSVNQTNLAFSYAKKLSDREETLFLNLDTICALSEIRAFEGEDSVADLIYYSECTDKAFDKFGLYLDRIRKKSGNLSYIPAVFSGKEIRNIEKNSYLKLIERIVDSSGYENLVIDIPDNMNAVMEIIKKSSKVIVLSEKSSFADTATRSFSEEIKEMEGFVSERLEIVDMSEWNKWIMKN